jgi:two-component system, OmpR family, phosphate regulon response regulator PhoB
MSTDDSGRAYPTPPTALIAAADHSFRSFLEYAVKNRGLAVSGVSDGEALTKRLRQQTPDLLLVESRLPALEIRSVCARLRLDRRTRAMLIIVLAADGDETNQHEILESGADQYLSRPFSPEKLMTSIDAVWHNADRILMVRDREQLTFLDVELDSISYRVRRSGRTIHLAPTEFRLLHHLMKNPHRVYSRNELQSAAWPRSVHLGPRTIDVHIGRLRAALNEAGGQELIRTVRSVGYALSD